ncbi:MAG: OmpH family outer membrane protein [Desulfomonilaceae bacterium]
MRVRGPVKTFVILSTCFLMLITISALSFGAEMKFGKVSLTEVRRNSAKAKAALEQLRKAQTAAVMKINSIKKDIEQLQEKLKSEKDALSQEEKAKLKADLEDKKQGLQVEEQAAKIKLTFQQKSIQNAVKTQIDQAIEKIAKQEGISAVFMTEMLLYSQGIVDLTDKVTKALDSLPPLETGTE